MAKQTSVQDKPFILERPPIPILSFTMLKLIFKIIIFSIVLVISYVVSIFLSFIIGVVYFFLTIIGRGD